MPVTWCYDVEDGQKYCNPGFPIGCFVTPDGRVKDACVINVSGGTFFVSIAGVISVTVLFLSFLFLRGNGYLCEHC